MKKITIKFDKDKSIFTIRQGKVKIMYQNWTLADAIEDFMEEAKHD